MLFYLRPLTFLFGKSSPFINLKLGHSHSLDAFNNLVGSELCLQYIKVGFYTPGVSFHTLQNAMHNVSSKFVGMKTQKVSRKIILIAGLAGICISAFAQNNPSPNDSSGSADAGLEKSLTFIPSPIVDFEGYLKLAQEVQVMRKNRLLSLDSFLSEAQKPHVVILDTRSDSLYKQKHFAGAIHLDFSNFTQDALYALIPDPNTKILIYCNNNFKDLSFMEPDFFVSKAFRPNVATFNPKGVSLALNIPTFINLVGYGFTNVYELGEQVFVSDGRLKFEGEFMNSMKKP